MYIFGVEIYRWNDKNRFSEHKHDCEQWGLAEREEDIYVMHGGASSDPDLQMFRGLQNGR